MTLTVHKGSVKKYLEVALETGEKYGVSDYTMQRLEQLERRIDSLRGRQVDAVWYLRLHAR